MARRLFNGRAFSEDGWPYVDEGSCTWVLIPGSDDVWLEIQNGPPLALLRAWAADWNAYIEPLRDRDSACWTPGNSVATSNHPGGTAIDLNWDSHRFEVRGTLNAAQMSTMKEMEDFYEGMVFWAGRWGSPVDEMHSQCGYNTYDQDNDRPFPKVNDFIARKIRADGFSTLRRGNAPMAGDPALVLSQATGLTLNRATEILPTMVDGLKQADCTNANRVAMFIAQTGHESASFNATEEYQSGDESQERWKYKGRTWIQLTWLAAYEGFGKWCFERGLVSDPNVFVNNPKSLADLKWAGLGAAYYWTVQRPAINGMCDARDLLGVSREINGRVETPNGMPDRTTRYNRALAMGDQLLALIAGDDDELADPAIVKMIQELHGAMFNKVPSPSLYATPGEGPRWQLHELIKNDDGFAHEDFVEREAARGNPSELARVVLVAQGLGVVREQWAVDRAKRVLAQIEATNPEILQQYLAQKGRA